MISDEKLASLAVGPTPEQEKVVRNVVRPVISEGAAVSHALQFLQDVSDMAQELLAYREAERKANSWDDAPEWANCRAKDQHCEWIYLELRPYSEPPTFDPPALFGVPVYCQSEVVRWIATLERRPK